MITVTLGRRGESGVWHVFLDESSMCWNGVRLQDCRDRRYLLSPEDADRVPGEICGECLKELGMVAEIASRLEAGCHTVPTEEAD